MRRMEFVQLALAGAGGVLIGAGAGAWGLWFFAGLLFIAAGLRGGIKG